MTPFDPGSWFFTPADEPGVIIASATGAIVQADDADLAAWKALGNLPSVVPSRAELYAYLVERAPDAAERLAPVLLTSEPALRSYAAARRYAYETAGVTISGTLVATDRDSQALINGAYNLVTADPSRTIRFKGATGAFVELDAATMTAIAVAVGAHVQNAFAREADACAGIDGGLIVDTVGIDSIFS